MIAKYNLPQLWAAVGGAKEVVRENEEHAGVVVAGGAKHAIAAGKRADVKKGTVGGRREEGVQHVFLVKQNY